MTGAWRCRSSQFTSFSFDLFLVDYFIPCICYDHNCDDRRYNRWKFQFLLCSFSNHFQFIILLHIADIRIIKAPRAGFPYKRTKHVLIGPRNKGGLQNLPRIKNITSFKSNHCEELHKYLKLSTKMLADAELLDGSM